ncbi:MAG: hypothetical protein JWN04_3299 [Myxococcaceae bacterium]|nr:hypothetical protein [Myxococcaceae bacterium]
MRIFFASLLRRSGSSGRQRLGALRSLGHEVREFQLNDFDERGFWETRLRERLVRRAPFRRRDETRLGRAFVAAIEDQQPDVVWVEKALLLTAPWIRAAKKSSPNAVFVCFQDDDPFGLRAREMPTWSNFKAAISSFDVHFVKREPNVAEFKSLGARHFLLFTHGVYDHMFHPSADPSARRNHDLVFVGTPLDHRVATIDHLIKTHGLPLEVFGNGWYKARSWLSNRERFQPEVVEESYGELLRDTKIALGFVSSSNRDEYSMRTFEIPACGALLLAERTPAHQSLFEEGREAEFFQDANECAEKCAYYLSHEAERARIAAAGCVKVLRAEHSLEFRMQDALHRLLRSIA